MTRKSPVWIRLSSIHFPTLGNVPNLPDKILVSHVPFWKWVLAREKRLLRYWRGTQKFGQFKSARVVSLIQLKKGVSWRGDWSQLRSYVFDEQLVCCQHWFSDGVFKEQIISVKQDPINFLTPPLVNWPQLSHVEGRQNHENRTSSEIHP